MPIGPKGHRDRKNGASREEWKARKAAANAARGEQECWFESGPKAATDPHDGKWMRLRS
jgi:hypothetical protein